MLFWDLLPVGSQTIEFFTTHKGGNNGINANFTGLFNFERHGQNEVGNIEILVLWRDREKLYS